MVIMVTEVAVLKRFLFRKTFSIKFSEKFHYLLKKKAAIPDKLDSIKTLQSN